MKILVTGASGFVGLPVVQGLLRDGETVTGLSRKTPDKASNPGISWMHADLASPETYKDAIRAFAPEAVIHLAWQGIPDYSFATSKINLVQSLDFLSFVTGLGTCRKILVAGSCWELNQLKGECLETKNGVPKDDFTWSKHALRTWLEAECMRKDICLNWMRIFYVYGPRQRSASLIPSILHSLREHKLPKLRTPLNANDFVYVGDVADAFAGAVSQDVASGIYHLGSGGSTSVLEVCRTAEQIVNGSTAITRQMEDESKNTKCTINFWADCTQAREALGWSPQTSLSEGIENTWQWMERQ